ncbi:hypothetical protein V8F20_009400 [Naviculisporaceae sp. PSN 640]
MGVGTLLWLFQPTFVLLTNEPASVTFGPGLGLTSLGGVDQAVHMRCPDGLGGISGFLYINSGLRFNPYKNTFFGKLGIYFSISWNFSNFSKNTLIFKAWNRAYYLVVFIYYKGFIYYYRLFALSYKRYFCYTLIIIHFTKEYYLLVLVVIIFPIVSNRSIINKGLKWYLSFIIMALIRYIRGLFYIKFYLFILVVLIL